MSTFSMKQKLNVCLVGLGRAGKFHMHSIAMAPSVDLLWAVDMNPDAISPVVERFGCKGTTNIDEALADPLVDVVIVASPTDFHYEHITKSFAAKKCCFTEKPISHDMNQVEKVCQMAEESGCSFLVGFQRRYDINFMELKNHMDNGAVGAPRIINTTSRDNPEPPLDYLKSCGTIFEDMLVHDFDILFFLTNQVPNKVYSVGHCYNKEIEKNDDCDTAMCTFSYPSGLITSVNTSRISPYGYDQRIEAFGDKGMCTSRNRETHHTTLANVDGYHSAPSDYSFPERYPQAYSDQLYRFFDMVRAKECQPTAALSWMKQLFVITECAERSWRTGQPIDIPFILDTTASTSAR